MGEHKSFRLYHLFWKGHFTRNYLKSTKRHHHAKKAEKQEDSESYSGRGNEMFVIKAGLKTSTPNCEVRVTLTLTLKLQIPLNLLGLMMAIMLKPKELVKSRSLLNELVAG